MIVGCFIYEYGRTFFEYPFDVGSLINSIYWSAAALSINWLYCKLGG